MDAITKIRGDEMTDKEDLYFGLSARFWFWMWVFQVFFAPILHDYIRGVLIGLGFGD